MRAETTRAHPMLNTRVLKVLIFEEDPANAELVDRALCGSGLRFTSRHTSTKNGLLDLLENFAPDVVLIPDSVAKEDTEQTFTDVRRIHPEVPIVLIVESTSDDTALALMMAGAKNYVLKSDLQRLPTVVQRAIDIEAGISSRKSAERATKESEEWFHLLFENAPDATVIYDPAERRIIDANAQAEVLFGCGHDEIVKHPPWHFYSPEQPDQRPLSESVPAHDAEALAGKRLVYERQIRRRTGDERTCLVTLLELPSANGHLLRGSFVDITERSKAEEGLKRTNRALRTLSQGNAAVLRSVSEGELLDNMCRVIVEEGGYRMAWIGEAQHDEAKLVRFIAWAGEDAGVARSHDISWSEQTASGGITGRAIRTGEPQTSQDFLSDPNMTPWMEAARKYDIRSAAALPLKDHSGVFAVLRICASEPHAFDPAELRLLQELTDHLSFGINTLRARIQHERMEQRWRTGLQATIGAISSMMEMRDPYTSGHQQRVAGLARAMARLLGYSEDDVEGIYLAAIVHDVGKVTVPAEILNKPGKLSKTEFMLIQEHVEAGYNVLKGIDFPWPVAEMVRQHHERLDGSGYPRGLKGDALLPQAMIIAVADVVDAMTLHRPYRPARGIEVALAEIENNSGRLFDRPVVDACITLFRQRGFRLDCAE